MDNNFISHLQKITSLYIKKGKITRLSLLKEAQHNLQRLPFTIEDLEDKVIIATIYKKMVVAASLFNIAIQLPRICYPADLNLLEVLNPFESLSLSQLASHYIHVHAELLSKARQAIFVVERAEAHSYRNFEQSIKKLNKLLAASQAPVNFPGRLLLKKLIDEATTLANNDWSIDQLTFVIDQTYLMLTNKISVTEYQNFAKTITHGKESEFLTTLGEIMLLISGIFAVVGIGAMLLPTIVPILAQVAGFGIALPFGLAGGYCFFSGRKKGLFLATEKISEQANLITSEFLRQ